MTSINVSRSKVNEIPIYNAVSIGASYTHISTLKTAIGPDTKRIVMYHSMLENLEGFENSNGLETAYLGFNRIYFFRPEDLLIKQIGTLDLVGNPIRSLKNCPPCKVLIVSATQIKDLEGCPDGVEILRCGHSSYLESLKGCPSSVKIIECSCTPNLNKGDLPSGVEEFITDTN